MRTFISIVLSCVSLAAQTPPAGPQFEVASVKPVANDAAASAGPGRGFLRQMMRNGRQPGLIPMPDPGRVRLKDWALLDLIAAAYSVPARQVSGPDWLADQSFDVEAKMPDGAPKESANAMLRSLLEERFGLQVHRVTQTKQGYALVVGKNGPKLKPAEPPAPADEGLTPEERRAKSQKRMQENMADIQKRMQEARESGTPLQGLSTAWWPSVTTPELASRLVQFAEAPVADETGLTGKYSVSIETWKNGDIPGGAIFDAVEKLGLKLEPRKITLENLVVDQVSKTPTAN